MGAEWHGPLEAATAVLAWRGPLFYVGDLRLIRAKILAGNSQGPKRPSALAKSLHRYECPRASQCKVMLVCTQSFGRGVPDSVFYSELFVWIKPVVRNVHPTRQQVVGPAR